MDAQAWRDLQNQIEAVNQSGPEHLSASESRRLADGLRAALSAIESSQESSLDRALVVLASALFDHTPLTAPADLQSHPAFNTLYKNLLQIRAFALALASGDLARRLAVKGVVAGSLKSLQANLRHLTWQTQRIAENDFSQHVDFMGEFSEAFNSMVARLADTLNRLQQREGELLAANRELENYRDRLEAMVAERTAELDQTRRRLQTILDNAGEGIELLSPTQEVQYVNPAMEQLTGYAAAEMIGATPRLWRSPATSAAVLAELERSVAAGHAWQGELICRRKDGQHYDALVHLTPLKIAGGRIIGFVVVHRDITRLKELARLKDQFVTRVGHELRTPLTSIMLCLDLLEKGKVEKRASYLQMINQQALRLRDLIESYLEMARWNTDSINVELSPYAVPDMVKALVADFTVAARERDLRLVTQVNQNLPRVLAESGLLFKILTPLLDNAVKYTPRGGTITLSGEVVGDETRDWITLVVHNDGPGLSPDELPRLFEPFYRGRATENFATPGVGLGLSIAQAVVRHLGGRITVESERGQGVTFKVWLRPAD